jgi:hypothetical protein
MRIIRETDHQGRFLRKRTRTRQGPHMKSAFDDKDPYGLTALGEQFVRYAMTEIVPKIEQEPQA